MNPLDTEPMEHEHHGSHDGHRGHGHGGHGWMMMLCCVPMLVIAIVLVATGVVNAGFLVSAVGCLVMMAVMMRMMGGMGDHR